jgi:hypothetical protein
MYVQERLALTLRFLASGDLYVSMQYRIRISKQAISCIVKWVCLTTCRMQMFHLTINYVYCQSTLIFQLEVLTFFCSTAFPHLHFLKTLWVLWVPYYLFSFIKFDKFYDTFLSPLHNYKNAQETAQHYRFAPLFKTDGTGTNRREEERTVVKCHVARPDLLRP